VFRKKTFYMIVTSVAAFAFLYSTDFTAWLYHALHKDELEAHWAGRLYDESYQLLLKRSKRRLLEERNFLAASEDRDALSRTDLRVVKVEPKHSFLTWRYSIAKDGSVNHTFKLWKFDVQIDIDYALKVRTAHVGNMRARGLLGIEDMHLLAAEVVPRAAQPAILLTKREKPLSFDLGVTAYPPHLSLPDKWGVAKQ
jgi:hypothetical protein